MNLFWNNPLESNVIITVQTQQHFATVNRIYSLISKCSHNDCSSSSSIFRQPTKLLCVRHHFYVILVSQFESNNIKTI